MKQIIARLLLQPNKNFPIDCEMLASMQDNNALTQILGNIAGDKAILLGCEPRQNGAERAAGYVFARTADYPEGEVLYWEGGAVAGGMYLSQETIAITAQGYDFPQAYTERSLRAGVGKENFSWSDFRQVRTLAEQEDDAQVIRDSIVPPAPLGIVQMWGGAIAKIPVGYALCDGSSLSVTDYPELYAVLGTTHGGAGNLFRLPDLRSRFVVGYNDGDADYNALGKTGGSKAVALTSDQLAPHTHSVNDYYFIENNGFQYIDGQDPAGGRYQGNKGSDSDNDMLLYKTHDTASAGNGTAHENRPPYYVMAYIMKLKN